MVEAGLLVSGDDIPVPFDRFRDRVMFPITDLRGRVIAFGGRALDKDAPAKYLNSPETPLFHKGGTLYNIAAARQASHEGAPIIVVEGYIDVIAMVTAGFPATVAPLGTALTEDQLGLLWKMADEPVLCFDGDNAGLRAAYRAVDLAMPRLETRQEPEVRAAAAGAGPGRSGALGRPRCRSPTSSARQSRSPPCCGRARPKGIRSTRRSGARRSKRASTKSPRGSATKPCGATTARISTRGCRNSSRPRGRNSASSVPAATGVIRARAAASASAMAATGSAARRRAPAGRTMPYVVVSQQMASSPVHRGNRSTVSRREALILQAALNHPWLLHDHLEEFASLEFRHPDAEKIKGALIDIAAHAPALDADALKAELAARNLSEVMARIALSITTPSVWGARPEAAPDDVLVTWSQLVALHRQWHSLTKELKDAEQALGQDASEANYLRLRDVKGRLERVEGTEALIEGFGASSGRGVRSL